MIVLSADGYDAAWPVVLHLSYSTSYTPHILTFTIMTFLLALPLLPLVPLRPLFLVLGLTPFVLTHPYTRHTLPLFIAPFGSLLRRLRTQLGRLVDDDRLDDDKWHAELRQVELFENERWIAGTGAEATRGGTWSGANLKAGERVAWTRGRDGWSGISVDGGGDVRSVLLSRHLDRLYVSVGGAWVLTRNADAYTAVTSRLSSIWDGRSWRRKTGALMWKQTGALWELTMVCDYCPYPCY